MTGLVKALPVIFAAMLLTAILVFPGCGKDCHTEQTTSTYGLFACVPPTPPSDAGSEDAGSPVDAGAVAPGPCDPSRDPSTRSPYAFANAGTLEEVVARPCAQSCGMIIHGASSIDSCEQPSDDGMGNVIMRCTWSHQVCSDDCANSAPGVCN